MNGTPEENERRKGTRKHLEDIVADFQRAEAVILKEAQEAASKSIRSKLPIMQANAVHSGHMVGKLNLEVLIDFTPGKKKIEVRAFVQPLPVTSIERKDIVY